MLFFVSQKPSYCCFVLVSTDEGRLQGMEVLEVVAETERSNSSSSNSRKGQHLTSCLHSAAPIPSFLLLPPRPPITSHKGQAGRGSD